MNRREVVALLSASAVGLPMRAGAQGRKTPVVRILSPASSESTPLFDAFRARLRELGYVEGRSIELHFHLAKGRPELLQSMAEDAVRAAPDVIVGDGALSVRRLKNLTTTIPIVAILGPDPVASGLIGSLARPDGNITGVTTLGLDLHPKRAALIVEAVPFLTRLGVLWDRDNDPGGLMLDAMRAYAERGRLSLELMEGGSLEALIAALASDKLKAVGALMVSSGPAHFANRKRIIELVGASRLPAIYPERDYVIIGGLMSYGPNVSDVFKRLAEQVNQILKGARPADISVEQVARFEYVVNVKTAETIGLDLPQSLLSRADQVLE
jgi:ABC-type uncharacterized transport system substrate-binding protein